MNSLFGIWAASVTPFRADLSVDHARLASHLRFLLDSGCHGVVILGTTGEANSLSVSERLELMDRVGEAGLPVERILVGTGCTAHADSLVLTSHAVELGFRGVLLLPPFYYKSVTDAGLFESCRRLIEGVSDDQLRIMLYHFPRMAGAGYSNALIARLVDTFGPVIEGVKDSTGDEEHTLSLCSNFPGLSIFTGTERLLPDVLAAGGAGCISASVNVTSELCRRVFDGLGGAAAIDSMKQLRASMEQHPFAPGVKLILSRTGASSGWTRVRPPLVELPDTGAKTLLGELSEYLNY